MATTALLCPIYLDLKLEPEIHKYCENGNILNWEMCSLDRDGILCCSPNIRKLGNRLHIHLGHG